MPWPQGGRREPPQITLVDPKDRFVFLPLLIDYAIGGDVTLEEFAPQYSELLQHAEADRARLPSLPGTAYAELRHLRGHMGSVDWRRRRVRCSGPDDGKDSDMDFDALVVCPGPLGRNAVELPGLREAARAGRAQAFASLADAEALRTRLATGGWPSVAVVGAGYVGVELATALAEAEVGSITLFGGGLMRGCEPKNQERAADRLLALGVHREVGRVVSVDEGGVSWKPVQGKGAAARRHDCDLVLVTGSAAEALAGPESKPQMDFGRSSVAQDGRFEVDTFLRVVPGIYCIGDAASSGTAATGQAAMQQAEVASWNAFAQCAGLPRAAWKRYAPAVLGEYVALGREEAAAVVDSSQLTKLLPPALPPTAAALVSSLLARERGPGPKVDLGGRSAALLRRLSYLYRMPTLGHRAWVAQQWAARAKAGAPLPA